MLNSREGLLGREKEVMKILNLLSEQNLDFIVVGGYAISTYKKRFSVDLDIVIQERDLKKFEDLLIKKGYALSYNKKVELLYGEKFKRFEKKMKGLAVDVDFLINGLVSRTTDSTWSFDYIKKNSEKRKLDNSEFLTPKRELIVAMKFHSGRLSDIRDIVALMPCSKEELKEHLLKGNIEKLKSSMKRQLEFLQKPQFDDSFKGIFGIHMYREKNVKDAIGLIKGLLATQETKIPNSMFGFLKRKTKSFTRKQS
ncbi:hypothetical protein CMI37_07785 [Candidatus Pacearchaeota archaeon]|nr:hypothetical protein [Candidatus Pacearchaeota archaeon]|tara:strand:+ start:7680 stop:8441 length:762 start_codon:yes stop_codon:yes gene_type:complete